MKNLKKGYSIAKNLVWFTQLAFSVISPLVLCIWGSVWLTQRFELGAWLIILGTFAGIGGAISGFASSLKAMKRSSDSEEKGKQYPVSFNEHK